MSDKAQIDFWENNTVDTIQKVCDFHTYWEVETTISEKDVGNFVDAFFNITNAWTAFQCGELEL